MFVAVNSAAVQTWNAAECAVLLSGLAGDEKAAISRRLTIDGVARERILLTDL